VLGRLSQLDDVTIVRGNRVDIHGPVSDPVQIDGDVATTLPAVIDLAARGLGLAYTFRDFAAPQLASGALVPLLEEAAEEVPGVYLYFPREYRSMVPLRLFLDHLKAHRRAPADAAR